ncbi:hypothetical protein M1B74_08435 [Bacteroides pyogenes]|uniref:hypothetical protein n=1 Tax=Bacteroides pyogenes TaxID=310300 RepID=UPI003B433897
MPAEQASGQKLRKSLRKPDKSGAAQPAAGASRPPCRQNRQDGRTSGKACESRDKSGAAQ